MDIFNKWRSGPTPRSAAKAINEKHKTTLTAQVFRRQFADLSHRFI
jgi:hypothetical protein